MMPRYRKKPIIIEARLWDGSLACADEIVQWSNGIVKKGPTNSLLIQTLEGEMRADVGDWIIKGVKGEFYPCKPDIFKATYEAVAL